MLIRECAEQHEKSFLAENASKSAETRGRIIYEKPCDIRTEYQRDRDRIIHSKAFRRLMHKTQVFLAPEGDHFRTRLTHTVEVSQISRTIARALRLNEDLTEAIAMGHDLGHTPFGHNGEEFLDAIHPGGFKHNFQSLRVVDVLECTENRRGMNLTEEVRDGILNHTGNGIPFTLEGQIVKISDRIAYINHDIDDALRAGIIKQQDIPEECVRLLGETHSKRINNLVTDLIMNSKGEDSIRLSDDFQEKTDMLRKFMFKNVYHSSLVKKTEELEKINMMLKLLYNYFMEHTEELPHELSELLASENKSEIVKDHIAGMTDRYAINIFEELYVPKSYSLNAGK